MLWVSPNNMSTMYLCTVQAVSDVFFIVLALVQLVEFEMKHLLCAMRLKSWLLALRVFVGVLVDIGWTLYDFLVEGGKSDVDVNTLKLKMKITVLTSYFESSQKQNKMVNDTWNILGDIQLLQLLRIWNVQAHIHWHFCLLESNFPF